MDRGDWWARVHKVTESQIGLSMQACVLVCRDLQCYIVHDFGPEVKKQSNHKYFPKSLGQFITCEFPQIIYGGSNKELLLGGSCCYHNSHCCYKTVISHGPTLNTGLIG